jgi:7-cyano-7-deazaguanine synthase
MNKKAVVLHSGGLDSTTALYLAKSKGFEVNSLSFSYGQRHNKELEIAKKAALEAGVNDHKIINIDISAWGGSALTDDSIQVPDYDASNTEIPVTYVPARNMIFLSMAASYAEAIGAYDIFIGVSQLDYSGYVDCREEFIQAMEKTINMGTVCAVEEGMKMKIHTPFMFMNKDEEIKLGMELGVNYANTWSCYRGSEKACGTCDSCQLRLQAFKAAGFTDPLEYEIINEVNQK